MNAINLGEGFALFMFDPQPGPDVDATGFTTIRKSVTADGMRRTGTRSWVADRSFCSSISFLHARALILSPDRVAQ